MAGKKKWYKWTVEIQVDESWVADGFNLDTERAHSMLSHTLPYAYGHELRAKIVAAPAPEQIFRHQGYTGESLKAEITKFQQAEKEAKRGR